MHFTQRRLSFAILSAALTLGASDCYAHARWMLDGVVKPRDTSTGLKVGPCGNVPRTTTPAVFAPGQAINVEWEETIDHPGYFIISFSPAGDANFDQYVLAPRIVDTQNGTPTPHFYQSRITLPDQACTDCTLQLIQVMEEDPLNPTNYYSCADIQLIADPGGPPPPVTNPLVTPGAGAAQLSWTATGGASTLVLISTAPITARPTDGTRYAVGQQLGAAQVVYQGTDTTTSLTGLSPGVTYYLLLIAFDNQLRYAAPAFTNAFLPNVDPKIPANVPPEITFSVTQRGRDVEQVRRNGGRILLTAQVSDPNASDSHQFDWSATDNRLVDEDTNPATLSIDPSPLDPGTYAARVTVIDNGQPPMSATTSFMLVIEATATDPPAASPAPPAGTGGTAPTRDDSASKERGAGANAPAWLAVLGLMGALRNRRGLRSERGEGAGNHVAARHAPRGLMASIPRPLGRTFHGQCLMDRLAVSAFGNNPCHTHRRLRQAQPHGRLHRHGHELGVGGGEFPASAAQVAPSRAPRLDRAGGRPGHVPAS